MHLALRRPPALCLSLVVAALAGCRTEPTAPPEPPRVAAASSAPAPPAPPAPARSGPPPAASPAPPDDSAPPDNTGCKRRRNSGVLASCEAYKDNLGTWSPTPREVVAVMQLADTVCYCADALQVPAETCARRVKSGTVKLQVGQEGEPTDCTITISAAEWKGRRWVVIDAFNRDLATFYSTLTLYEHTAGGFRRYYQGFNGLPDDKAVREGAEGVSPEMKRDWPTLPAQLRAAFEHKSP